METKICFKCKIEKPLDSFGNNKITKTNKGKKSYCKKCEAEKVEQHRQKLKNTNPEKFRRKQNHTIKYNIELKKRNFAFILRYLQLHGKCTDCGITDNRILEFDHVVGEKTSGVILMADKLASIQRIKEEIRKCEIRCCNCHRIKTQEQFGWRNKWTNNWIK